MADTEINEEMKFDLKSVKKSVIPAKRKLVKRMIFDELLAFFGKGDFDMLKDMVDDDDDEEEKDEKEKKND